MLERVKSQRIVTEDIKLIDHSQGNKVEDHILHSARSEDNEQAYALNSQGCQRAEKTQEESRLVAKEMLPMVKNILHHLVALLHVCLHREVQNHSTDRL